MNFRNPQSAIRNPQSAIVLAFLAVLAVTWQRWTGVIADTGRELDLPWRLWQGEVLYRDVYFLYPPFAPYANAALYGLFGPHLSVLNAAGCVAALAVVLLSYHLARRLLDARAATLAACAVLVLCVAKPAGNLIAPYAFAALYGLLFALGALLCVLRYGETRASRWLLGAGVCLGLALITKQEFALAALVAVLAGLAPAPRQHLAARLAWAALPALALSAPVFAYFLHRAGWRTLVEDCHLLYTHLPPSLIFYNAQRTGLAQPLSSLLQMFGAAAASVLGACALVTCGTWRAPSPASQVLRRRLRWCVLVSLLAVVAVLALTHGRWDGSPLRALPLLLAGLSVYAWRSRQTALFVSSAFSLALLARVALRVPSGGAYGSFFLPPALVLICYALLVWLPPAAARWAGHAQVELATRRAAFVLLTATLCVSAAVFAIRARRNFSYAIHAPRGTLHVTRALGPAYQAALDFLAAHSTPDDALAVVPEGSDLAFLSARRMALRLQIFHPGFLDEAGERAEIARLAAARVRYVLIVNRPMREFGATAFGRDYFPVLGEWIKTHYRLAHVCGEAPPATEIGDARFFIKIYARADD